MYLSSGVLWIFHFSFHRALQEGEGNGQGAAGQSVARRSEASVSRDACADRGSQPQGHRASLVSVARFRTHGWVLCAHWHFLERDIVVLGIAEKVESGNPVKLTSKSAFVLFSGGSSRARGRCPGWSWTTWRSASGRTVTGWRSPATDSLKCN